MIPVTVISLIDSLDRRAMMRQRLDALGIPFSFLDAVDGRHFTDEEARRLCPGRLRLSRRWPMSKNEVACTASHLAAIRRVAEGEDAFGCILEDDAIPENDFASFLDPAWLSSLPPFDLMKLAGDPNASGDLIALPIAEYRGHKICAPLHPSYGARAYLVSKEGARRTLGRARVIVDTADVFLFRVPAATSRILDVRPFPATSDNLPSTLEHDRDHKAPAPWWRPILAWAPYTLATFSRKTRRYLAFLGAHGVSGLRKAHAVPFA